MDIYKFIRIKGLDGERTGYFIPRMYQLVWSWNTVRAFGLNYIKDRLNGWTIWFVKNEEDYIKAIEILDELKKTRMFEYQVSR